MRISWNLNLFIDEPRDKSQEFFSGVTKFTDEQWLTRRLSKFHRLIAHSANMVASLVNNLNGMSHGYLPFGRKIRDDRTNINNNRRFILATEKTIRKQIKYLNRKLHLQFTQIMTKFEDNCCVLRHFCAMNENPNEIQSDTFFFNLSTSAWKNNEPIGLRTLRQDSYDLHQIPCCWLSKQRNAIYLFRFFFNFHLHTCVVVCIYADHLSIRPKELRRLWCRMCWPMVIRHPWTINLIILLVTMLNSNWRGKKLNNCCAFPLAHAQIVQSPHAIHIFRFVKNK